MNTKIRYGRNPLVRQLDATFTTEHGTEYQVIAFTDSDTVRFGIRTDVSGGWHYGTFRYADSWRERNSDFAPWDDKRFRRMMTDYMRECDSEDE